MLLFPIVLLACGLAQAQSWADRLGKVAERAARSEVERTVDQQTRKATRCALGDDGCVRDARKRGEEVEVVDDGNDAASADPGGDHPLITPYAGSKRVERKYDAYNEYQRIVGWRNRTNVTERLEGKLTRLRYANPKGRSTFELIRNYRDALVAKGFKVDYECATRDKCGSTGSVVGNSPGWGEINGMNLGIAGDVRYFTGKMPYGDGTAYVSVGLNKSDAYVHVLETARMDTGMVGVTADSLAAGLAADGKVVLDGLYFDTGKATLQAGSDPSLEQAALLLRQQPSLKLMVVGHTDNTGTAATNMTLSQQRAEAVRRALMARGIAASRLSAQGVGSSVPVASNATEAGRAKNRRVELVKQ
jgi:outer membrane protein OmpA-like peptidoglycan-associated protein